MKDQAEALRRMALAVSSPQADQARKGALVLVYGTQIGAGTSTLAIHLALGYRRHGWATLLVDANRARPTLHEVCQSPATVTLTDVFCGHRTLREARLTGPCGLPMVVAAPVDSDALTQLADGDPIVRQLAQLARQELVVVDVGCLPDLTALLPIADHCLFVTPADQSAMTNAYCTIKEVSDRLHRTQCWLAVNHVEDSTTATALEDRIRTACDQCLNLELRLAGQIPRHTGIDEPPADLIRMRRRVGPFGDAIDRMASRLESRFAAQQATTLREIAL